MELKTYFAQDASGNIMPGATVTVYEAGTATLATGLQDESGSPLANPFTADNSAKVAFYAPDGLYDINVVGNGRTVTIRAQFVSVDGAGVLRADLAATGGSELVGFVQSGPWAVPRAVQDKARETISVFDFMTTAQIADIKARTLSINVSSSVANALSSNRAIAFEAGSYYLGEYSISNDLIFQLHDGRWDLRANGDVEFVVRTSTGTGVCTPIVFDLKNAGGSSFGNFRFRDLGFDDSGANVRGLKAYRLSADSGSGSWGDVSIDRIDCTNCVSGISFEVADSENRVRGVNINEIILENCYYGLQAQNQGDSITVGIMRGDQVRRIYFVYGCKTHNVNIIDRNPKGSTGTVNISRSTGGFNTEQISVSYKCKESNVSNLSFVNINHIDLLGGAIKGIYLNLDIDVPLVSSALSFINYQSSGGAQDSSASLNVVDGVVVEGRFGSTIDAIYEVASYATRGKLDVRAVGASVTNGIKSKFLLETDSGTWTPVLVDGDRNPSEGQTSSVAVGYYQKRGSIVQFSCRLKMSSLGTLNTTQAAVIYGLPYTSSNSANLISSVNVGYAASLNISATASLTGYVAQNSSNIVLQKWSATTGTAGIAISEITASGEIAFSGHYTV